MQFPHPREPRGCRKMGSMSPTRGSPVLVATATMWEIATNSVGNYPGNVGPAPGQGSYVSSPLTQGYRQNRRVRVDKTSFTPANLGVRVGCQPPVGVVRASGADVGH
jgi:hypothetical protein